MANPAPAGERIVGGAVVNPPHSFPYQGLFEVNIENHICFRRTQSYGLPPLNCEFVSKTHSSSLCQAGLPLARHQV